MVQFDSTRSNVIFVAPIDAATGTYKTQYSGASAGDGLYSFQIEDDWQEVPESAGSPSAAWWLYDFAAEQWIPRDLPEDWQG